MAGARSLAELADLLVSPEREELVSPLTGEGILYVDLEQGRPSKALAEDAARVLPELPCPSLALLPPDADASRRSLAEAFDVVVATPEEADVILATVRDMPLAALCWVQLLRASTSRSIHEGLVAESLVYSTLQSGPEFARWRETASRPPPPEETDDPVRLERVGDVLSINLARPHKRNAFNAAMRDALVEALRLLDADDSITRAVLRGDGPAFCSGGDLDEFGSFPDPTTAHAVRSTRSPAAWVARCSDRLEARVHGACVGAGIELPAFCHRVVAEADSFFMLPEVSFGLVPGAGGSVSLPRRIGRQRTARLGLTGERLDAPTALDWGLVDELLL